ncbi:MAG: exonuclease SbcCD subunit D [Chloroflexi bacterium]|nr:exonuclease SbcCD subunit D [Chloroflexota bacterium]
MRILHFADLHIGVENYGRLDPRTGLNTRFLDFLRALDQVVDYAVNEGVDLVLFAGDAYKSREPGQTHQRELARRIACLSDAKIPAFLLVGNHDLPQAAARAHAVEVFHTLRVPNIVVGDSLKTYLVETRQGPVQVVSLPWVRRSVFLNREEAREMTLEQVNTAMEGRLTEFVQGEVASLNAALPSVLAAHVTIAGATTGTEQSLMLGRVHVLLPSAVIRPELDYVALGHVHKHQTLGAGGPTAAYSGSLQRVDFSEEKEAKGFCVVDLDPSKPQGARLADFRFVPVDARPFVTIDINIGAEDDPDEVVRRAIARHETRDAVVRVRLRVAEALSKRVRDRDVRALLGPAHFSVIARSVERPDAPTGTSGPHDLSAMDPHTALAAYLDGLRDLSPQRRARLLSAGERLIAEERERKGE